MAIEKTKKYENNVYLVLYLLILKKKIIFSLSLENEFSLSLSLPIFTQVLKIMIDNHHHHHRLI